MILVSTFYTQIKSFYSQSSSTLYIFHQVAGVDFLHKHVTFLLTVQRIILHRHHGSVQMLLMPEYQREIAVPKRLEILIHFDIWIWCWALVMFVEWQLIGNGSKWNIRNRYASISSVKSISATYCQCQLTLRNICQTHWWRTQVTFDITCLDIGSTSRQAVLRM